MFFHHHVYLKALCLGCFVQVLLHALKSEGSENCSWLMAFCSWLASTVTARQQCHPSQQLNQFFNTVLRACHYKCISHRRLKVYCSCRWCIRSNCVCQLGSVIHWTTS